MSKFTITRGRPPQYVKHNGKFVRGLSLKSDGRFYTTHNDPVSGLRVYFGRELENAIRLFRRWRRGVAA